MGYINFQEASKSWSVPTKILVSNSQIQT